MSLFRSFEKYRVYTRIYLAKDQKIRCSLRDLYSILQLAIIRWYYLDRRIEILNIYISSCFSSVFQVVDGGNEIRFRRFYLARMSTRSWKSHYLEFTLRNLARLSALWMEARHIKMIPVQFSGFHSSSTSRHSINMVFVRLNRAVKSSYYSRTL